MRTSRSYLTTRFLPCSVNWASEVQASRCASVPCTSRKACVRTAWVSSRSRVVAAFMRLPLLKSSPQGEMNSVRCLCPSSDRDRWLGDLPHRRRARSAAPFGHVPPNQGSAPIPVHPRGSGLSGLLGEPFSPSHASPAFPRESSVRACAWHVVRLLEVSPERVLPTRCCNRPCQRLRPRPQRVGNCPRSTP